MNQFVRQLVVLTILWALCELVLPEGRREKMVRFTLSLLVMLALVAGLCGLLGQDPRQSVGATAIFSCGKGWEGGEPIAAQTLANQVSRYVTRMAQKVGYEAKAKVTLGLDGSLKGVEVVIAGENQPLLDREALKQKLVQALSAPPNVITVRGAGDP